MAYVFLRDWHTRGAGLALVGVSVTAAPCGHVPLVYLSLFSQTSRSLRKVHNFGKRSNSIKRNPNAPVTVRNWLYKKANSGMKLWKKRWFVLSDLCLFYYRDEKEEGVLGSILLPSFQISPVTPEDHINRMFAFKVRNHEFCTFCFLMRFRSEGDWGRGDWEKRGGECWYNCE
uniref:PH domain-containing protein n=1 Tax=Leptobrachium leishanense TaxID=445787 RepID=A0A8C5MMJ0_9ANUR